MSSRIGHGRRGRRNCSFLKNRNNGVHGDRKQEVAAAGLFPPDHARSRGKGARVNGSRHEESRQGLQAANLTGLLLTEKRQSSHFRQRKGKGRRVTAGEMAGT